MSLRNSLSCFKKGAVCSSTIYVTALARSIAATVGSLFPILSGIAVRPLFPGAGFLQAGDAEKIFLPAR